MPKKDPSPLVEAAVTRAMSSSGLIALPRALTLAGLVCIASLAFIGVDIQHRVTGYLAARNGVQGTANVKHCEYRLTGGSCTGDFTTVDGQVVRDIRVNGAARLLRWDKAKGSAAPSPPARFPAAIADAQADEAWTVDGRPWLAFSALHLYALILVILGGSAVGVLIRSGLHDLRHRVGKEHRRHVRRAHRRGARRTRRGQLH